MTALKSWADSARRLIDTAMGRTAADMVIRKGRWVNVHSGEIIDNTDIAIAAGRFAYVGPDAAHCIGKGTTVIEAHGRYLVPGLCDGHMHVESGMVTATDFATAATITPTRMFQALAMDVFGTNIGFGLTPAQALAPSYTGLPPQE